MPNKNYQRGRRLEWAVKKILEDAGYTVTRCAGSHGPYDLMCVSPAEVTLIQLKMQKGKHANEADYKGDLEKLLKVQTPPCAFRELHVYADRQGLIARWRYDWMGNCERNVLQ